MTRKSLTEKEVELLTNLEVACSLALRVGLAIPHERANLKRLAAGIAPMIEKLEQDA